MNASYELAESKCCLTEIKRIAVRCHATAHLHTTKKRMSHSNESRWLLHHISLSTVLGDENEGRTNKPAAD